MRVVTQNLTDALTKNYKKAKKLRQHIALLENLRLLEPIELTETELKQMSSTEEQTVRELITGLNEIIYNINTFFLKSHDKRRIERNQAAENSDGYTRIKNFIHATSAELSEINRIIQAVEFAGASLTGLFEENLFYSALENDKTYVAHLLIAKHRFAISETERKKREVAMFLNREKVLLECLNPLETEQKKYWDFIQNSIIKEKNVTHLSSWLHKIFNRIYGRKDYQYLFVAIRQFEKYKKQAIQSNSPAKVTKSIFYCKKLLIRIKIVKENFGENYPEIWDIKKKIGNKILTGKIALDEIEKEAKELLIEYTHYRLTEAEATKIQKDYQEQVISKQPPYRRKAERLFYEKYLDQYQKKKTQAESSDNQETRNAALKLEMAIELLNKHHNDEIRKHQARINNVQNLPICENACFALLKDAIRKFNHSSSDDRKEQTELATQAQVLIDFFESEFHQLDDSILSSKKRKKIEKLYDCTQKKLLLKTIDLWIKTRACSVHSDERFIHSQEVLQKDFWQKLHDKIDYAFVDRAITAYEMAYGETQFRVNTGKSDRYACKAYHRIIWYQQRYNDSEIPYRFRLLREQIEKKYRINDADFHLTIPEANRQNEIIDEINKKHDWLDELEYQYRIFQSSRLSYLSVTDLAVLIELLNTLKYGVKHTLCGLKDSPVKIKIQAILDQIEEEGRKLTYPILKHIESAFQHKTLTKQYLKQIKLIKALISPNMIKQNQRLLKIYNALAIPNAVLSESDLDYLNVYISGLEKNIGNVFHDIQKQRKKNEHINVGFSGHSDSTHAILQELYLNTEAFHDEDEFGGPYYFIEAPLLANQQLTLHDVTTSIAATHSEIVNFLWHIYAVDKQSWKAASPLTIFLEHIHQYPLETTHEEYFSPLLEQMKNWPIPLSFKSGHIIICGVDKDGKIQIPIKKQKQNANPSTWNWGFFTNWKNRRRKFVTDSLPHIMQLNYHLLNINMLFDWLISEKHSKPSLDQLIENEHLLRIIRQSALIENEKQKINALARKYMPNHWRPAWMTGQHRTRELISKYQDKVTRAIIKGSERRKIVANYIKCELIKAFNNEKKLSTITSENFHRLREVVKIIDTEILFELDVELNMSKFFREQLLKKTPEYFRQLKTDGDRKQFKKLLNKNFNQLLEYCLQYATKEQNKAIQFFADMLKGKIDFSQTDNAAIELYKNLMVGYTSSQRLIAANKPSLREFREKYKRNPTNPYYQLIYYAEILCANDPEIKSESKTIEWLRVFVKNVLALLYPSTMPVIANSINTNELKQEFKDEDLYAVQILDLFKQIFRVNIGANNEHTPNPIFLQTHLFHQESDENKKNLYEDCMFYLRWLYQIGQVEILKNIYHYAFQYAHYSYDGDAENLHPEIINTLKACCENTELVDKKNNISEYYAKKRFNKFFQNIKYGKKDEISVEENQLFEGAGETFLHVCAEYFNIVLQDNCIFDYSQLKRLLVIILRYGNESHKENILKRLVEKSDEYQQITIDHDIEDIFHSISEERRQPFITHVIDYFVEQYETVSVQDVESDLVMQKLDIYYQLVKLHGNSKQRLQVLIKKLNFLLKKDKDTYRVVNCTELINEMLLLANDQSEFFRQFQKDWLSSNSQQLASLNEYLLTVYGNDQQRAEICAKRIFFKLQMQIKSNGKSLKQRQKNRIESIIENMNSFAQQAVDPKQFYVALWREMIENRPAEIDKDDEKFSLYYKFIIQCADNETRCQALIVKLDRALNSVESELPTVDDLLEWTICAPNQFLIKALKHWLLDKTTQLTTRLNVSELIVGFAERVEIDSDTKDRVCLWHMRNLIESNDIEKLNTFLTCTTGFKNAYNYDELYKILRQKTPSCLSVTINEQPFACEWSPITQCVADYLLIKLDGMDIITENLYQKQRLRQQVKQLYNQQRTYWLYDVLRSPQIYAVIEKQGEKTLSYELQKRNQKEISDIASGILNFSSFKEYFNEQNYSLVFHGFKIFLLGGQFLLSDKSYPKTLFNQLLKIITEMHGLTDDRDNSSEQLQNGYFTFFKKYHDYWEDFSSFSKSLKPEVFTRLLQANDTIVIGFLTVQIEKIIKEKTLEGSLTKDNIIQLLDYLEQIRKHKLYKNNLSDLQRNEQLVTLLNQLKRIDPKGYNQEINASYLKLLFRTTILRKEDLFNSNIYLEIDTNDIRLLLLMLDNGRKRTLIKIIEEKLIINENQNTPIAKLLQSIHVLLELSGENTSVYNLKIVQHKTNKKIRYYDPFKEIEQYQILYEFQEIVKEFVANKSNLKLENFANSDQKISALKKAIKKHYLPCQWVDSLMEIDVNQCLVDIIGTAQQKEKSVRIKKANENAQRLIDILNNPLSLFYDTPTWLLARHDTNKQPVISIIEDFLATKENMDEVRKKAFRNALTKSFVYLFSEFADIEKGIQRPFVFEYIIPKLAQLSYGFEELLFEKIDLNEKYQCLMNALFSQSTVFIGSRHPGDANNLNPAQLQTLSHIITSQYLLIQQFGDKNEKDTIDRKLEIIYSFYLWHTVRDDTNDAPFRYNIFERLARHSGIFKNLSRLSLFSIDRSDDAHTNECLLRYAMEPLQKRLRCQYEDSLNQIVHQFAHLDANYGELLTIIHMALMTSRQNCPFLSESSLCSTTREITEILTQFDRYLPRDIKNKKQFEVLKLMSNLGDQAIQEAAQDDDVSVNFTTTSGFTKRGFREKEHYIKLLIQNEKIIEAECELKALVIAQKKEPELNFSKICEHAILRYIQDLLVDSNIDIIKIETIRKSKLLKIYEDINEIKAVRFQIFIESIYDSRELLAMLEGMLTLIDNNRVIELTFLKQPQNKWNFFWVISEKKQKELIERLDKIRKNNLWASSLCDVIQDIVQASTPQVFFTKFYNKIHAENKINFIHNRINILYDRLKQCVQLMEDMNNANSLLIEICKKYQNVEVEKKTTYIRKILEMGLYDYLESYSSDIQLFIKLKNQVVACKANKKCQIDLKENLLNFLQSIMGYDDFKLFFNASKLISHDDWRIAFREKGEYAKEILEKMLLSEKHFSTFAEWEKLHSNTKTFIDTFKRSIRPLKKSSQEKFLETLVLIVNIIKIIEKINNNPHNPSLKMQCIDEILNLILIEKQLMRNKKSRKFVGILNQYELEFNSYAIAYYHAPCEIMPEQIDKSTQEYIVNSIKWLSQEIQFKKFKDFNNNFLDLYQALLNSIVRACKARTTLNAITNEQFIILLACIEQLFSTEYIVSHIDPKEMRSLSNDFDLRQKLFRYQLLHIAGKGSVLALCLLIQIPVAKEDKAYGKKLAENWVLCLNNTLDDLLFDDLIFNCLKRLYYKYVLDSIDAHSYFFEECRKSFNVSSFYAKLLLTKIHELIKEILKNKNNLQANITMSIDCVNQVSELKYQLNDFDYQQLMETICIFNNLDEVIKSENWQIFKEYYDAVNALLDEPHRKQMQCAIEEQGLFRKHLKLVSGENPIKHFSNATNY